MQALGRYTHTHTHTYTCTYAHTSIKNHPLLFTKYWDAKMSKWLDIIEETMTSGASVQHHNRNRARW